jgi:tetratricopeptide (TPR) repeat protein
MFPRAARVLLLGVPFALLFLQAEAAAQDAATERGAALFRERRYDEARRVLSPLAATDAYASYWLGRVAAAEKKVDEAEGHLERAVKLRGDVSEFHLWLGRVYGQKAQDASKLRQPGLAKKTKASWERAVALDAENLDARADLVSFYLMAPSILGGSESKAAEQAEEIRKRNPYRGALEAVRVAEDRKDTAKAERELRALAAAYPDSAAPSMRLVVMLSGQQRYDDAFAVVDGMLVRRPRDPSATYQLGRLAALSGRRLDEGEAALRRYLTLEPGPTMPTHAGAQLRLGQILEKRGNIPGARTAYEASLSLDAKQEEARKGLERLRGRQ